MLYHEVPMPERKRIALIAHDNKKQELLEWAMFNRGLLAQHELYATGTTGKLIAETCGLAITALQSGPLGGDQQIGARIVEGGIDFLIFFWDPLEPLPHDPDIKALLRIAVVWNIPVACNRSSADFMISSPLMRQGYQRLIPDYTEWGRTPRQMKLQPWDLSSSSGIEANNTDREAPSRTIGTDR